MMYQQKHRSGSRDQLGAAGKKLRSERILNCGFKRPFALERVYSLCDTAAASLRSWDPQRRIPCFLVEVSCHLFHEGLQDWRREGNRSAGKLRPREGFLPRPSQVPRNSPHLRSELGFPKPPEPCPPNRTEGLGSAAPWEAGVVLWSGTRPEGKEYTGSPTPHSSRDHAGLSFVVLGKGSATCVVGALVVFPRWKGFSLLPILWNLLLWTQVGSVEPISRTKHVWLFTSGRHKPQVITFFSVCQICALCVRFNVASISCVRGCSYRLRDCPSV